MPIRKPTTEQISELAITLGMRLQPDDVDAYQALVSGQLEGFAALDALPDGLPPVHYPRTPGSRPTAEENPLGAWYVRTRVEGAAEGKLAGRGVVLKDNVMLGGVIQNFFGVGGVGNRGDGQQNAAQQPEAVHPAVHAKAPNRR